MRREFRIAPASCRIAKVPIVVPDIPVIHRPVTENFAFATRMRGAWCSGDRDGSPSLPGRPATARRKRQATEGPISAGRQWEGLSGSFRGQPGRGAGRDDLPVARRGSWISSWDLVSEAGRERGYPKKGRGTSDGLDLWSGRTSKDKRTFGRRSQVEVRAPLTRGLCGGKRRLSW